MKRYIGLSNSKLGVPLDVAWNPNGKFIAISGTKGVRVYTDALDEVFYLNRDDNQRFLQSNAVAWSPDGDQLAGGYTEGEVIVWNLASGTRLFSFQTQAFVTDLEWSSDGKRIACAVMEGKLQLWDLESIQKIATLEVPKTLTQKVTEKLFDLFFWEGPPTFASIVAWSPDNAQLVNFTPDCKIRIWNANTAENGLSLIGHTRQPFSAAWSPDGSSLVSAGLDKEVRVWNIKTAQLIRKWKAPDDILRILWSPDGNRIIGACRSVIGRAYWYSPTILVWDANTGEIIFKVENHVTAIEGLALSPDGKRVVAVDSDYIIEIWEMP